MRTLADILNRTLPSDPPRLSPEYIARTARDQQKLSQEPLNQFRQLRPMLRRSLPQNRCVSIAHMARFSHAS
jgi:hypothetical protein